jgi:predicted dinucleotide-binding enzyme
VPYDAALELITSRDLAGKVVVDMTNPITADFSALKLGHTTSAAEVLQQAAPTARVVKAFNTIFAGLFDAPRALTAGVPVFVAGNDEAAVAAVADLAQAAGFAVEKTGTLDASRLLEPVGLLNIRLGYGLGQGTAIAPSWLRLAA